MLLGKLGGLVLVRALDIDPAFRAATQLGCGPAGTAVHFRQRPCRDGDAFGMATHLGWRGRSSIKL